MQHRRRLTNRTPEPDRRDRRRSASRCPFLSRADRPSPEASRAKGCLALEGCSPVAGGVRGRSRAVASVERSSAHVVSNQRGRPILRAGGLAGVAHPGWAPRRRASRRRGPALTPRSDRIWLGIDDLKRTKVCNCWTSPTNLLERCQNSVPRGGDRSTWSVVAYPKAGVASFRSNRLLPHDRISGAREPGGLANACRLSRHDASVLVQLAPSRPTIPKGRAFTCVI